MKIQKRTANAIRKYGYTRISNALGLMSRQTVYSWYATQSIPDKYVPMVTEITGIELK